MGQSLQIDEHGTRLRVGSQILPRNRPHIGRENVVSLLGELSPNQGACRPLRPKKHDVGTCRHSGSPGGEIAPTPVPVCATVSRIQERINANSGCGFSRTSTVFYVMAGGRALWTWARRCGWPGSSKVFHST